MKLWKRIAACLLALAMVVPLAGCGESKTIHHKKTDREDSHSEQETDDRDDDREDDRDDDKDNDRDDDRKPSRPRRKTLTAIKGYHTSDPDTCFIDISIETDRRGRITKVTEHFDEEDPEDARRESTLTYDRRGFLVEAFYDNPYGQTFTETYQYDEDDRLVLISQDTQNSDGTIHDEIRCTYEDGVLQSLFYDYETREDVLIEYRYDDPWTGCEIAEIQTDSSGTTRITSYDLDENGHIKKMYHGTLEDDKYYPDSHSIMDYFGPVCLCTYYDNRSGNLSLWYFFLSLGSTDFDPSFCTLGKIFSAWETLYFTDSEDPMVLDLDEDGNLVRITSVLNGESGCLDFYYDGELPESAEQKVLN